MAIPGRSSPETGEAKASKAERKRTKTRKAQSESGAQGAEPAKDRQAVRNGAQPAFSLMYRFEGSP